MASKELLDLLNKAIARELQVSIQYMWQHVQWSGVKGYAVHDEFKSIGIVEMKHAEKIAERLFYLGGKPTTEPAPITVGENLKDMLKEIIEVAEKEGDVTTAHLFRGILEQEEEHHDVFTTLIEDA
ncbi:ferritin-like domain-containing protein [Methanocella conradii]|uniref:ferritin-like domain-containing protein n=1 Tax=Methanocella conradii TaxID=1175444 RepID=UPI00157C600B|nr:ferritin-like domain-containing protein [Methanocella conradii]